MDMVGDAKDNVQPDIVLERTRDIILNDEDDTLHAALELLRTE